MNKVIAFRLIFLLPLIFNFGCSYVVEPIVFPGLKPDQSLQEEFKVELYPLTLDVAKVLNKEKYDRFISRPGKGYTANIVKEASILQSQFPPESKALPYLLGIGDVLEFKHSSKFSTKGRVGTDGTLLLLDVGILEAAGKEITELREEIRSILIRNGQPPNFQLEISSFNSKKAFITFNSYNDKNSVEEANESSHPIKDQGTTLREIIASSGIVFDSKYLTLVKLQRGGTTYTITLAEVFSDKAPYIYLRDKDHVFIERLEYLPGKVFLVGGVTPTIVNIKPEIRQSLTDILFLPGGPLELASAQRSSIYVFRGIQPIKAYHLDTQNPTRILIAEHLEMRPNDIVFVGEQPIDTFNRMLSKIVPLRVLSGDAAGGNIAP